MAADVSVKNPPANPCCTVWKEKCTKLEAGRKHLRQAVQILNEQIDKIQHLRQAVQILNEQIDKIQVENVSLKKAYEEERLRAETEKEGKEKELAVRVTLENDLSLLKSEITSLKEKESAYVEDEKGELKLLQDHVSKAEKEITQLKALLKKEKIRADSEKKSVEAQKKIATEAWKQVKVEKAKADEERKLANIEGKKAEEYQLQLEGLRKQVDEAKSKLVAETLKFEEACKKLEAEKHKVIKQRKRADSEMAKAEVQRKLAEANGKKVVQEKSHAENLSQLLENAKQRIGELQKEIAEKAKADTEMKNVNTGWKKAEEYQIQLELLRKEADETKAKLTSEILKFEEANKRLEIEKNRVTKERKRADAEMAKANELRKLAETNAKLAMEEKSHADQLSGLLEESRHKMEELQKQMQELLPTRKTVDTAALLPGKDVKVEMKLKLLDKELKLERTRLKYAKQVAKLEKNRSGILQDELGRIRLDSIQISERLDALNKWFSSSVECRESLGKAGVSSIMQRSKLKRKFDDLEALKMYAQNESELLKPSCVAMAASFPLTQTLYCADPWLPVSGGNCTGSISGIDSKLKSLHGGSYRKLLQSSAINSSSGSFSDGQLVGSQEIGAFVSKSEKLVEENSDVQTSISGLSGEVTKTHCNEKAVVAEKSARNHLSIDTSGRGNGHGRKLERMLDAIESVEFLYSEGKKLHMQMEEKLSVLHGMLNRGNEKPMAESKYVEASVQNGSHAKCEKSHKKKRIPFNERIILQHEQEKTTQIGDEVHADANACRHTGHPGIKDIPQECIKVLGDSFRFDCKSMAGIEKIENGEYMKLLDLDDTADEECYRRAMEMPLSPTLPEIEISSAEIFSMDKFKAGDSFHGELLNEKEILMPCSSSDIVDAEISSNNMRCIASGASFNEVQHENEGLVNSFNVLGNGNGCCDTMEAERAPDRQTRVSDVIEKSHICSSSDEGLKFLNFSSESKLESAHDNIPTYYVVFSNYNDYDSVSRIFCATRTCLVHCSLDTETESMVKKVLSVLKMEEKLLPKEKACTFFTLLLLNFTAFDLRKPGSCMNKNLMLCLDSFAEQINAVVSDVKSRSLLASLCCLDELLSLIEDFLINGRVIECTIVPSETLVGCDSRRNIFLNGINVNLSSKPASADQLVAGSIILASVCAAVDRIEFICEASYNLLRIQKYDIDILLAILHVFAYLGGDRFFSLKEYGLTMKVLKTIIIFLEGGHSPVASAASRFSSLHVAGVKFHSCGKCPFGAVSVDIVVTELLEKLQNQHPPELANLPNFHVLSNESDAKRCSSPEGVCCALDANSGASCCVMPATHITSVCNGALCYLSDVLSLVELLACYMNWEWTCGKIIPALLDILGRPMLDDFSVAVVVLIGQLGRLGVAACGYEDKEVENLKYKLSGFLQRDATTKLSLPVQIAAVTSLLGILPFDLQDVIQGNLKLPEGASQFVFADLIRNWFSSLSKEQQTLSSNLLHSAGLVAR
ncbi:uncharacterized protein LOC105637078 isoform X1 [Jatropha curcas]|uniref:uncharacterized protein LOC105637078 isoform X1 n=1 Tax=Jatropha curcas TaxID=180498 RepID=UPI001895A741|nr:uncharacterized protein LOC105637078 isoform X1 [Jatropha curcas]